MKRWRGKEGNKRRLQDKRRSIDVDSKHLLRKKGKELKMSRSNYSLEGLLLGFKVSVSKNNLLTMHT